MIALALVSVMDDHESVREALPDLLPEFGFVVETFRIGEGIPCVRSILRRGRSSTSCSEP
jgi:FixJ family two-component response regulator